MSKSEQNRSESVRKGRIPLREGHRGPGERKGHTGPRPSGQPTGPSRPPPNDFTVVIPKPEVPKQSGSDSAEAKKTSD